MSIKDYDGKWNIDRDSIKGDHKGKEELKQLLEPGACFSFDVSPIDGLIRISTDGFNSLKAVENGLWFYEDNSLTTLFQMEGHVHRMTVSYKKLRPKDRLNVKIDNSEDPDKVYMLHITGTFHAEH